jgi:hypothetical protein
LTGLCSRIEEVNANIINPKLCVIALMPPGGHPVYPQEFPHNLYRVTLKNGEVWAVDPSGAQHGHTDPLCPWHDFERQRSSKITDKYEFGYIRYQLYQSYGTFAERLMVVQSVEKLGLTKALEENIPALAREHKGELNTILKGSDAAFNQAKIKFLDQFEDCVKASMAKLYAPEQIARRNEEIKRQLSLNMADPYGQEKLKCLRTYMASAWRGTGELPRNARGT